MNKINKDLCQHILNYLKIKDKYNIGQLNKRFNWLWNNHMVLDIVKKKNTFYLKKFRFLLPPTWLNINPYIGVLNKCERYPIKIEVKITSEIIYFSYEERRHFNQLQNNYIWS
jgi:hypothetical protein